MRLSRWDRWAAEQAPAAGQAQGGRLGPQGEPEPLLRQVTGGRVSSLDNTLVPRYPRKHSLCITDHRLNMNSYLMTEEWADYLVNTAAQCCDLGQFYTLQLYKYTDNICHHLML